MENIALMDQLRAIKWFKTRVGDIRRSVYPEDIILHRKHVRRPWRRHNANEIPYIREPGPLRFNHIIIEELQVTNIKCKDAGGVDPEYLSVIYEQVIANEVIERMTTRPAAEFHKADVIAGSVV
jgi:hypothetical protein